MLQQHKIDRARLAFEYFNFNGYIYKNEKCKQSTEQLHMLCVLEMEITKKIKTDGRHLSWIFCATVQSPSCPSPMSTWLHQSDTRWTCCCLCKFGPLWDILKYDFHLSKQIPSPSHLIWCNRGANPNQPRILFLIWKTFRYFNWTQTHKPCNQSTSGPRN